MQQGATTMLAAATPIEVGSKLSINDRPLQTSQNVLAIAEGQPDILKPIGGFVEVDDRVVSDHIAIVVKNSKLNHEAHAFSRYLMNR